MYLKDLPRCNAGTVFSLCKHSDCTRLHKFLDNTKGVNQSRRVSRLYASQDRQINRVLSGLCRNRFSQADLGMRAEFRSLQEDAAEGKERSLIHALKIDCPCCTITELACLALKQTPLEKLRCLGICSKTFPKAFRSSSSIVF